MGSKLIILLMLVFCVGLVSATVTITPPLAKTVNVTASSSDGGDLTANTTYYYRIVALKKGLSGATITSTYGAELWGLPSDETSGINTTGNNQTINLTWNVVPNATGYLVYRTEVSGDYDANDRHLVPGETSYEFYYASTTTNFFSDDNIHYESRLQYCFFLENGLPMAVLSGSTEESPDTEEDIYDALIAGGYTNHTSRLGDGLGRYTHYYFLANIDIQGWWRVQMGKSVYHEGTIRLGSNSGWLMGEKTGNTPYRGTIYTRNFVYTPMINSASSTIKWYAVRYKDLFVDYGHSQCTTFRGGAVLKNEIIMENCLISWPSLHIDGRATGSIIDTTFSNSGDLLLSSGKMFISGMQISKSSYGVYQYYATENPVLRDTVIKGVAYDIFFHKNTVAVDSDVINHQWQNDPPTARASSNPSNLNVRRKYEFELKIIDKDGDAINNATIFIVDALNNNITPEVSDANGQVWITSGTATSGGDNTLTDTNKNWGTDALKDLIVEIISGTGSGQERSILSNNASTIITKGDWTTNPDSTSNYSIKIHVMSHSYLGKATSPYYDTTVYNPFNITISKDDYKSYVTTFNVTEKIDWTIMLEEQPPWNYSEAPLWKILNLTGTTIFKLSADGNLAIAGILHENTNTAPDNILWNFYDLIWITKNGDVYIKGVRVW